MDELQGCYKKKRYSYFKEWWLPELQEFVEVFERKNGSFTFETSNYGVIDFFPKSNALLIRKDNNWKRPGLKWIKENILK
jgi:hypothetical protein